jgi:RNA polymerase sigma factor (sigma-70 family)
MNDIKIWSQSAACSGIDPDELFVDDQSSQRRICIFCRGCSVRIECLADALDKRIEFGVWGGFTERERRALLRRKPDVESWFDLLKTARENYGTDLEKQDQQGPDWSHDFAAFFRQEFKSLVNLLVVSGARFVDAEDAAQMAFIEIARTWHAVLSKRAWIRKVAFRIWAKIVQKDAHHTLVADLPEDIEEPDEAQTLIDESYVLTVMSTLPHPHRIALAWAYHDFTPTETASCLGIPASTVRQHLHRARAAIARELTLRKDA